MYTVYHIRNGTVNIMWCLHRSFGGKYSLGRSSMKLGEFYENYAGGKVSIYWKQKRAQITSTCCWKFHRRWAYQILWDSWRGKVVWWSTRSGGTWNISIKYRTRQFWCRGYYVDTVGKNEKKIAAYIQDQLKEDEMSEQLTLEMDDPFTGNRK